MEVSDVECEICVEMCGVAHAFREPTRLKRNEQKRQLKQAAGFNFKEVPAKGAKVSRAAAAMRRLLLGGLLAASSLPLVTSTATTVAADAHITPLYINAHLPGSCTPYAWQVSSICSQPITCTPLTHPHLFLFAAACRTTR